MKQQTSPLYLMLPQQVDAGFTATRLPNLLQRVSVAALMFWADAEHADAVRDAVAVAHRFDVPLLLAGPIAGLSSIAADGLHIEGKASDMTAALQARPPQAMAGVGNLWNRHDAMSAGEAGADYVFFGSADPARSLDYDRIRELCTWWSELFEVPCVGAAASLAEAAALLEAGADFVALRDAAWQTDSDALAALARARSGIRS